MKNNQNIDAALQKLFDLYNEKTTGGDKLKKTIEKLDKAFAQKEDLIKQLLEAETAHREEFNNKKTKYISFMLSLAGAFVGLSFFPAAAIPVSLSVAAVALAARASILLRTRRTRTERANIQSAQSVFCRIKVARDLNLQARNKLLEIYNQIKRQEEFDRNDDKVNAQKMHGLICRNSEYFYHLYQELIQAEKNVRVENRNKPPKELKQFDNGSVKLRQSHDNIDAIHKEIAAKDVRLYKQGLKTIGLDMGTIGLVTATVMMPVYGVFLGAGASVIAIWDAIQTHRTFKTKRQIDELELKVKSHYKKDLEQIKDSIAAKIPAYNPNKRSLASTGKKPQKKMCQKLSSLQLKKSQHLKGANVCNNPSHHTAGGRGL